MKNLRDAILAVLNDADNTGCDGMYTVDAKALYILQAEFNIHFREPDAEQVDCIDNPS